MQVESDIETEDNIVDTGLHEDSEETASSTAMPDVSMIPVKAHHPNLYFSLRTFGKKRYALCSVWYPWLHYCKTNDSAVCFYCHIAELKNLPIAHNKDPAFSKLGFCNWKKAPERFNQHERTVLHCQAVEQVDTIPKTTKNVGEMLNGINVMQKAENRVMLRMIL